MDERRMYTLALLGIAAIGAGCMTVMQITKVEIDRGFADRLILFLGTISAAFIFMLKADRVEQRVEHHHQIVEDKLERNTQLTEQTKQAVESGT